MMRKIIRTIETTLLSGSIDFERTMLKVSYLETEIEKLQLKIAYLEGKLDIRDINKLQLSEINVNLGAGGVYFPEWISTDIDILDITVTSHWEQYFQPNSINRLVAEHVFEHLSIEEGRTALQNCYRYLKPGGTLRIAVPDGYRKDPVYANLVAPPIDGHKSIYTKDNLSELLNSTGYTVRLLEYFDENDQFHHRPWSAAAGPIRRSFANDTQIEFKRDDYFYTSLLVDAIKPNEPA